MEKTVRLLSGPLMPRIGLGTYPMDDATSEVIVARALELGYRSVDTAENYRNEAGVGRGLRASGIDRSEVFVTTKFNAEWHGEDLVAQAAAQSLKLLGLDYLDLLLIHWPNPAQDRYVDAWKGLIKLREQGLVRSIGVSNFKVSHLQRLLDETGVAPDVNQIQLNPFIQRPDQTEFGRQHGIVSVAWSPIGKKTDLLSQPAIVSVAESVGRTPAQVVLRWHLQKGHLAIPKTSNPERLAENLDVYSFELSAAQMAEIDALDNGGQDAADSDTFGH